MEDFKKVNIEIAEGAAILIERVREKLTKQTLDFYYSGDLDFVPKDFNTLDTVSLIVATYCSQNHPELLYNEPQKEEKS